MAAAGNLTAWDSSVMEDEVSDYQEGAEDGAVRPRHLPFALLGAILMNHQATAYV